MWLKFQGNIVIQKMAFSPGGGGESWSIDFAVTIAPLIKIDARAARGLPVLRRVAGPMLKANKSGAVNGQPYLFFVSRIHGQKQQ